MCLNYKTSPKSKPVIPKSPKHYHMFGNFNQFCSNVAQSFELIMIMFEWSRFFLHFLSSEKEAGGNLTGGQFCGSS